MRYIYSILNTYTNKSYIGQCQNFKTRKRKHLELLRRNEHFNRHLQFSYNKYGEEAFDFFIIHECKDEEVDYYEKLFIDFFDTQNDQYGYNIRDGGAFHQTPEMKERMTKTLQSKVDNVLQIDPEDYHIVKVWPSQSSVQKYFPIAINISLSCKDKGHLMGGYYWVLEKDFTPNWKPYIHIRSLPVAVLEKTTGKVVSLFPTKKEAEKQLHMDSRYMDHRIFTKNQIEYIVLFITREQYYEYQIGTCIDYPREEE